MIAKLSLGLILLTAQLLFSQTNSSVPFIRQRETNPSYDEGDWVSYSVARFVTSIAVGREYIYFGTKHSGITRYHQYRNEWDFPWTTSNGLADNAVSAVAYDSETSFIWCATRYAISYYQPSAHTWRNFFKDEIGIPVGDDIVSIGVGLDKIFLEARSGRLFDVNKFGGAVVISDSATRTGRALGSVEWFGLRAPRPKQLPQFFMSGGYLFDPSGYVEDFNFRRAEVVAAIEDKWGNMWLGTWGLGAARGDLHSLRLEMLEYGLGSLSVDALTFGDNVLWAGGSQLSEINHGITAWDLGRHRWTTFEQRNISELLSDQLYSITLDGHDLWFSTGHGLSLYSPSSNVWRTFDEFDGLSNNLVFDTAVDDSSVWVATFSGIDRISKKSLAKKDSVKITPISPGNLTLTRVRDLEIMENLLWAATENGVYVYDMNKKTGGYSDEIDGPLTNLVNSISRYENELWFGSAKGVDVFDVKKREWLGVPEGRAFPNTFINRVLASKEAAWATTNEGVMKFNRTSNSWHTFTTEDGLLDNRVRSVLLDGDYIWFGTDYGLTQFFWNSQYRID